MNNITFENVLDNIKMYPIESVDMIKKAYKYAENAHSGQKRESGEDYIIHPLNVAYILSEMNADPDTICAGLLHDVIEDTCSTKEEIENEFNKDIANLVDGVTKLSKLNFSSKYELQLANTRKIVTSISNDVRIIIIKLADRLHNMRTLQYKNEFKQKENSLETIEIFAPLAYYIGAYKIKNELEDLAFKYLKPDKYLEIQSQKLKVEAESTDALIEMLFKIKEILNDKNIPNDIKSRTKNIYGIYKKLNEGNKLEDIHDLLSLKIIVDSIDNCYRTLGNVHSAYRPINSKFKDYICNPKTNKYSSLHSTVFGPDGKIIQTQIRTNQMETIDSYGLTAYWNTYGNEARTEMQSELNRNYQFYESLNQIDKTFNDNQDFVWQIKTELFNDRIYVYTSNGEVIELPKGSTPIDFAYRTDKELAPKTVGALVNEQKASLNSELNNKDRVKIIVDVLSKGPKSEWASSVKTCYARRRIMDFYNNLQD